jgi:hypothetical protein
MHGESGEDDATPHGGFADGRVPRDRLDRGQTLDRNRFDTRIHTFHDGERRQTFGA